ncbi:MlaE family ABC transporter permease [Thermodesulfobacteriota bacterium]
MIKAIEKIQTIAHIQTIARVETIERIGKGACKNIRILRNTLFLALHIVTQLFKRKSYNNASWMVFIHQFYYTAIQVLPLFILMAVIFGTIVNGMVFQAIKNLGLTDYLGSLLMGFVVTEIAPFVTVLLIALRSSSAINAEIAVMKVNRELDTLDTFNIDPITYLLVPRILCGMLSMILLSSLFSILVLAIGLFVSSAIFGTGIDDYIGILLQSTSLQDIIITLLKCGTFGFFIILIPIRCGLNASEEDLTSIPVSVLTGMVRVFLAIVFIEVISSTIRFI